MRIGVLYPDRDATSPANWSGTPHGIADGLRAAGVDVVPLGSGLPPGLHHAVAVLSRVGGKRGAVADRTPVRQRSRTWSLARRIATEADQLDGIIAMGTEMYDLAAVRPPSLPVITYDDATFAQMWRNPASDARQAQFPESDIRMWIARQRRSCWAADVCAASTAWAARSIVNDYGLSPDRVSVVGMGHRPRSGPGDGSRDWSTPRFLFIGVDWQRKNGGAVLDAFATLRDTYPDATLDVVGRHAPITQPGVTDHGYLPREDAAAQQTLDALFDRSTAFVLPSRFDPSPIAYLEAASAGMPVIATTEGGAGELLGDAALTVRPDDPAALVRAMLQLADPATARSMGARASATAATSRWTDVARRLVDALSLSTGPSPREGSLHLRRGA